MIKVNATCQISVIYLNYIYKNLMCITYIPVMIHITHRMTMTQFSDKQMYYMYLVYVYMIWYIKMWYKMYVHITLLQGNGGSVVFPWYYRLRQNDQRFAYDIFKSIFLFFFHILKVWCRTGYKPLPEPMQNLAMFPQHIAQNKHKKYFSPDFRKVGYRVIANTNDCLPKDRSV